MAKHAVAHAQKDRSCLGPIETCYSGPEVDVLHTKSTGEGWNQYRLFILVLSMLFCVLKATDEVRDPYRLVCLVLMTLFCMYKTTDLGGDPERLVTLMLGTLFCMQKIAGEVWDP